MNTATMQWPDELMDVLNQQHALVDELSDLADRQAELIRDGQTDALLSLLTQRQGIIDRFAGTQADLGRLTENIEARLQTVDETTRRTVQRLLADIGERLAEVMQRDEQDQQALEAARSATSHEIGSLGAARQARRAYLGGRAVNNRFADQRG
jgi:hypothetical protein